jgi:hypothetical protein
VAPPVRSTVGAPTVRGTSGAGVREWKDFNPGRGTSETTNPLIQKDPWLLNKLKEREGKAGSKAVAEGRASAAEYNVSQEEGQRRLSAAAQPAAAWTTKNEDKLIDKLRKKRQLRGAGYDLYDVG